MISDPSERIFSEVGLLLHTVVLLLVFLRALHIKLHSHQQCARVPFLYVLQYLPFVFLIVAILTDVRWFYGCHVMYISLIISDVE